MTGVRKPSDPPVTIDWCRDPARAPGIAAFFVAHAGHEYISHSELQTGRAEAADCWDGDLLARVEAEARQAIAAGREGGAGSHCALALDQERVVGLAFLRFATDDSPPFGVIEDLLIDGGWRGQGLGQRFMLWIEAQCRRQGCRRLFLESGIRNHRAHAFFERRGFARTSVVMARDLSAPGDS